MPANIVKQLEIVTVDKPGMLAEVSSTIASQGINMDAVCAYSMEGNAVFYLVTSDNDKSMAALKDKGWRVKEDEVVMVDLTNKPGVLEELSEKLKTKNVNLAFCYGSTCSEGCTSRIIMKAEDNSKIIKALQ